MNLADVDYLDLDSIAKIIENFKTPSTDSSYLEAMTSTELNLDSGFIHTFLNIGSCASLRVFTLRSVCRQCFRSKSQYQRDSFAVWDDNQKAKFKVGSLCNPAKGNDSDYSDRHRSLPAFGYGILTRLNG